MDTEFIVEAIGYLGSALLIVSMTRDLSDLLVVYLLAKEAGLLVGDGLGDPRDLTQAVEHARIALAIDPRSGWTHTNLGKFLVDLVGYVADLDHLAHPFTLMHVVHMCWCGSHVQPTETG